MQSVKRKAQNHGRRLWRLPKLYPPSQKATGGSPWMNAGTACILGWVEARLPDGQGFHALAGSAASCEFFASGEKARCHGRKAVELHAFSFAL